MEKLLSIGLGAVLLGALIGAVVPLLIDPSSGFLVMVMPMGALLGALTGGVSFTAGASVWIIAQGRDPMLRTFLSVAASVVLGTAVVVSVLVLTHSTMVLLLSGASLGTIAALALMAALVFGRRCTGPLA